MKLFGLNDNITYSKNLRKKYLISSDSSLYVIYGKEEKVLESSFLIKNELLVK